MLCWMAMAVLTQDAPIQIHAKAVKVDRTYRVDVSGKTALPHRAIFAVTLSPLIECYDGEGRAIVGAPAADAPRFQRAAVQGRRFDVSFPDLDEGVFRIEARFDPSAQPDSVRTNSGEARADQVLIVGGGAAFLKTVASDEELLRKALAEVLAIFREGGGKPEAAREKLSHWYQKQAAKLSSSRLPATAEYLRNGARGFGIWGGGKGGLRGGGTEAPKEGEEPSPGDPVADFLETARQVLVRERALWDVKLALTWLQENLDALQSKERSTALSKLRDRRRADWSALDERLAPRAEQLNEIEKELGLRLVELVRRSKALLGDDGKDVETQIEECLKIWREVDVLLRKLPAVEPKK